MHPAAPFCIALLPLLGTPELDARGTPSAPPPVAAVPAPPPFAVVWTAAVEEPKVKVLNADKVYYGDAKTAKAPAVIDSQRVWDKIPEYQEIKKKGLTEADLEYWVLLRKASKKFNAAVEKAAKAKGKDLVAEVGAIEVKGETIPNITDAVLAEIP
jgi:hypothetical protein